MAWVRLDDQFFYHPKVIAAGRDARDMYLASLSYSAGQLTDGHIQEGAIQLIAAMAQVPDGASCVKRLVDVGLWDRISSGYEIHDYLDYNPSGDEVRELRAERAKAGRIGGLRSAEQRANTEQANAQANAQAKDEQAEQLNPTPSPSPSPDPIPDPVPVFLNIALPAASTPPTALNASLLGTESDSPIPRISHKPPPLPPTNPPENANLTGPEIAHFVNRTVGFYSELLHPKIPGPDDMQSIRNMGKLWGYRHVFRAFQDAARGNSPYKTLAEIHNHLGDGNGEAA